MVFVTAETMLQIRTAPNISEVGPPEEWIVLNDD